MSNSVVKVEGLSKSYVLKHENTEKYVAFREVLTNKTKSIFKQTKENRVQTSEIFWALNNVSFEVNQGERIGIIGRNGAGKSTLLKILSRIVTPTKGRITIDGRVASLLEVGTGFHPELSGRENIFLNGSILGMSKTEIQKKFDEIVAFSEVEKFLDTPVKRYSSGMYVRLAFAVAAHLEPEILIVDEVLAVGDSEFQKKCLGKMKDVSGEGRTILFVSHNIGAIRTLCNKAVLLENGRITQYDEVNKVIPNYLGVLKSGNVNGIKIQAIPLSLSGEWETDSDLSVTISWEPYRFKPGWQCDIAVYTLEGTKIFAIESEKFYDFSSDDVNSNAINFIIKNMGFSESDIRMDIGIKESKEQSYSIVIENCMIISPSDKKLPSYKRNDVIIIPKVTCKALKL